MKKEERRKKREERKRKKKTKEERRKKREERREKKEERRRLTSGVAERLKVVEDASQPTCSFSAEFITQETNSVQMPSSVGSA